MKLILYFVLVFLLFSCAEKEKNVALKKSNSTLVDLLVEDGLRNQTDKLLLSEAVKDIEIIPLETTDKSLISSASNIAVGEKDVFVVGVKAILRFDRKTGKFLNRVANFGQGPNETLYNDGVGVDDRNQLIYTLANPFGKNELKSFTYDGKCQSTVKVAKTGGWMESGSVYGLGTGARRTYTYMNGKHLFRRMLPVQDGSKGEPWQIGIVDDFGKPMKKIVDPSCVGHNGSADIRKTKDGEWDVDVKYAISSFAPSLNCYYNHINCLFVNNDTIYRYSEKMKAFKPRYILHCGERPDLASLHRMKKENDYYRCLFVSDILETKEYLYLIANQDVYSYLFRVNKEDGEMVSIRNSGEYKETPIMKVKYVDVEVPMFTNDLCGGIPFFPFDQNENSWIVKYEASDLLEQIDLEGLKATEVLMPQKKEQLIRILENLKEDDNPVIMIATLK